MSEKNYAKRKQLAQADLNFISQKPMEQIAQEMQDIKRKDVSVQVVQSGENITLFQMTKIRDDRTTAEIAGRLQRWAGNMTHVYCDGRIFHKKTTYVSMIGRWALGIVLVAPFVLCPLTYLATPQAQEFLTTILAFSVIAFILVGLVFGFQQIIDRFIYGLQFQHKNPKRNLSKPEKKDREQLLHYLTQIIRDNTFAPYQNTVTSEDVTPLSDEEIAKLIQQAELMARWKK